MPKRGRDGILHTGRPLDWPYHRTTGGDMHQIITGHSADIPPSKKNLRANGLAKHLWSGLSNEQKWGIGDQLVRGTFDWQEWFDEDLKEEGVLSTVLKELDTLRKNWEDQC